MLAGLLFLSCGICEEIEEVELESGLSTLGWAEDIVFHSANENSPVKCDHDLCFWNMKMGWMDESEIWQVLTQPVTVLDGSQRQQYKVRALPDADCEDYVGCVTYASQGVHVLERGEEWSLIEAYSSSVEGSPVKVYATLFQGYVETALLKEVPVDQTYGLVIDKQTQRMYVFKEGKLLTVMLVSTGFYNPKKKNPWNETPAGEFLAISWTGDFPLKDDDGNVTMICKRAIRINDGILLHEVPMIPKTDSEGNTTWSYDRCERYLGEKASHGCIRIQRRKTPEGINEEWLWKNLSDGTKKGKDYTKVIIWDDAGRELGYPDDSLNLYYNAKRDKSYYHSSPECERIKGSSKTVAFTWGELEDKTYRNLSPCPNCAPQLRKSGIDELNEKNNR
ncbi:MAG: L,D-transpeptidase [Clostridiales bacterium]|nr:L,D-transpeptidase [Clostridiales bacterium]